MLPEVKESQFGQNIPQSLGEHLPESYTVFTAQNVLCSFFFTQICRNFNKEVLPQKKTIC